MGVRCSSAYSVALHNVTSKERRIGYAKGVKEQSLQVLAEVWLLYAPAMESMEGLNPTFLQFDTHLMFGEAPIPVN